MKLDSDSFGRLNLSNDSSFVEVRPSKPGSIVATEQMGLFPGSFNPIHRGHISMLTLASQRLELPIWLELSLTNPDKARLNRDALNQRILKIGDQQPVREHGIVCTNTPTFQQKAQLFPGCTFIVGADTIERIALSKYYSDEAARDRAIEGLRDLNSHFLVFGRLIQNEFRAQNVRIPNKLRAICTFVDAEEFNDPMSSTLLRRQATDS